MNINIEVDVIITILFCLPNSDLVIWCNLNVRLHGDFSFWQYAIKVLLFFKKNKVRDISRGQKIYTQIGKKLSKCSWQLPRNMY